MAQMKVKDETKGSEMVKKEEDKDRLEESLYDEELIEGFFAPSTPSRTCRTQVGCSVNSTVGAAKFSRLQST